MSLTWKDAAATLLVAGAGLISYAKIQDFAWPLLGSWRVATLLLFLIGAAAYAIVGSGIIPDENNWTMLATLFGSIAILLLVASFFKNNKVIFITLMADIGVLWVIATTHHLFKKGT